MRVLRLHFDTAHFQSLVPLNDNTVTVPAFDAVPLLADWSPVAVRSKDPMLLAGDFWGFVAGSIACTRQTYAQAGEFFQMAGELLPLVFEGADFFCLNVLECINCLDRDKSIWEHHDAEPMHDQIRNYAFHHYWLPESPIFKIPETCATEILVVDHGSECSEDEFTDLIRETGLTGIEFVELWSDA